MMQYKWKNIVCALAALWLCVSPFVLHFRSESAAFSDAEIVGMVIGTLTLIAIVTYRVWEEWPKVILGGWLLASPWLLGFEHHFLVAGDMMAVGGVVAILSLWSLANPPMAPRSAVKAAALPPTATELLLYRLTAQSNAPSSESESGAER